MADEPASAEALRKTIVARFAVRLHCALILCACFGVGLLVTKLMLIVGVHAMWLRYAIALVAAYLVFLLGVRVWLLYAGFDRRILPSRRSSLVDNVDLPNFGGSGGGSGGGGSIFRGGGGRSGGAGASFAFGVVFALALVFALVAQHRFPEASTIMDVVRRL